MYDVALANALEAYTENEMNIAELERVADDVEDFFEDNENWDMGGIGDRIRALSRELGAQVQKNMAGLKIELQDKNVQETLFQLSELKRRALVLTNAALFLQDLAGEAGKAAEKALLMEHSLFAQEQARSLSMKQIDLINTLCTFELEFPGSFITS